MRTERFAALALAVALMTWNCGPSGLPETDRFEVVDTYHGIDVRDPYRWLEDGTDPAVREWSDAQNDFARGVLAELPSVPVIRERVSRILTMTSISHHGLTWRDGRLFAVRKQPPLEQPFLVVLDNPDDSGSARMVVDPNELDPEGHTAIDWYVPSPDATVVAVSLSRGGSESGDLHLFEVGTGRRIADAIPRVNGGTAGGDVAWTLDGSGFFYTRYPRPGERPDDELDFHQEIWFHAVGSSPIEDRYEFGRGFPNIAAFRIATDPSSGRLLATYQYGDSGRFELHVREDDGRWVRLASQDDGVVQATFASDGALFLICRRQAPRGKILRLVPGAISLADAETIVPEGENTLVSDFYSASPIVATPGKLYAKYQLGGPNSIRAFAHDGSPLAGPDVPPVSRIGQIAAIAGDDILYNRESYIEPPAWYRFVATSGETARQGLDDRERVDFSDVEVVREFAESKDGTLVPVNVIRPKGLIPDGDHPVLLSGYGGFGSARTPRFRSSLRLWLDQGGIYAEANIRGGGEYGEKWHRDGMLTRKQNVFDDFAAAMQHMIEAGYTRPGRLAIKGGSNGGLLMGAMITQHPEKFRVAVSQVGIYDMLRVERSPNGRFNIPEYGTVEDREQFDALYAYSPYHRVEDGRAYPAVLFTTGANDPRVDPMQSRKMTARLQAATSSDHPILLRTSADTGHGGSAPLSERIDEMTVTYAFLFNELGVQFRSD